MNLFGAEDTEEEEDGVIAALLNYVAGESRIQLIYVFPR